MAVTFNKTYNSPDDIVSLLQSRGLAVRNAVSASQYIRNIGYYRLSAYLYPFLESPKTEQRFKRGAAFSSALQLYRFDKKLRVLLFNEIEKIEVSLRSAVANIVANEVNDIFWITNPRYFSNPIRYEKTIELIDKELRNTKEEFINHFKSKYSNPYPPAWMLVEILPLGVITRIYENVADNSLRKKIAAHFCLPVPVFVSWLTVITLTRNSCCHHTRIWNKENPILPMTPKKQKLPWVNAKTSSNRIFYNICIIKWFVDIISPCNDMKGHLANLINQFPTIDTRAMGFPDHWEEEPLWQEEHNKV